jgi:uncharacterized membrane protein YgdD (TMEM256/DUF423 family)
LSQTAQTLLELDNKRVTTVKSRTSRINKTRHLMAGLVIFMAGLVIAVLSLSRLIIFPHLTPIGLGIGLIGLALAGYVAYNQRPNIKR